MSETSLTVLNHVKQNI